MPPAVALQTAATGVITSQVQRVSIPRRFTTTMRDIWSLQSRFRFHAGRRAYGVLHHPKFRAAYDFLCLRAAAGEPVDELCEWWTVFQDVDADTQRKMSRALKKKGCPNSIRSNHKTYH